MNAPYETLRAWKRSLETTPLHFEVHTTKSVALTRSINLRESAVAEAAAVGRDAVQRVFEVFATKTALEQEEGKGKWSMARLAKYYESVRFAKTSEPVNNSFLEKALPVWTNILSNDDCLQLLREGYAIWGKEKT